REFDTYIKPDEAFARRLQPVLVDEPTQERALEILRSLRGIYETFHGVTISDSALRSAVKEADEKIDYRYLPDSAIDLIDEACAKVSIEGDRVHTLPLGAVHAAAKVGKGEVTEEDIRSVIDQWVMHDSQDKERDARK
ncbi:MAG: type VI secretion system ATPase TssH, partial [bacterium]|nr:type VI secretion system ATPase TssH [bacterium]